MNTPTIEPITLSIEEELESALVKVNVTDLKIQELIDRARPHAKPIENEEQYLAAEKARKEIKVVRLLGEKGIERVDRHYLDLRQASLAKKKELLERINEPEAMILPFTKEWERKKEEEEKERQRQIEAMKEERKATIQGLGFIFVPGPPEHRYVLGETTIPVCDIVDADQETWMTLLKSATMVSEEVAQARAEEERLQQERQRRLEEQEKQQREAAEAIARQQAAIAADNERREKDLAQREAKINAQVNEARRNELLALGCEERTLHGGMGGHRMVEVPGRFGIMAGTLYQLTPEQWENELLAAKAAVEERDKALKEAQEKADREALVADRVKRLRDAGWVDGKSPFMKSLELVRADGSIPLIVNIGNLHKAGEDEVVEWITYGQAELARREAARQEQLRQEAEATALKRIEEEAARREQQEKERQAKLGDADRWLEWTASIKRTAPEMQSAIAQHAVKRVLAGLDAMQPNVLNDLK